MNNDKYKTSFGEDINAKIADGFCKGKKNEGKRYCSNCHREIYASNYTGTNLCIECRNKYYDKFGNLKNRERIN